MSSDRAELASRLPPNLLKVLETAERLVDEGLNPKAVQAYRKLLEYLPSDAFLLSRIRELENLSVARSLPVADGSRVLTQTRDSSGLWKLDSLAEGQVPEYSSFWETEMACFLTLEPQRFLGVAQDLAVLAGLSDLWQLSLRITERYLETAVDSVPLLLWKLRCQVELENYAEAVALFGAHFWPDEQFIHANYLAGLAYEGLGVRDQAEARFGAVHKLNPAYRDVARKFQNYL